MPSDVSRFRTSCEIQCEIQFGGEFERAFGQMVDDAYEELRDLDAVLGEFLPFSLLEPPEAGTLPMATRNALKALLSTAWMMGMLNHDARWLEERFRGAVAEVQARTLGQEAAAAAAARALEEMLARAPREAAELDRWLAGEFRSCLQAVKVMQSRLIADS